jgi:hypothetical protein
MRSPPATLALALALTTSATGGAEPSLPLPCVERVKAGWRAVRDLTLDGRALAFCAGDECWSFDLVTRTLAATPHRPVQPSSPPSSDGVLRGPQGRLMARADATHVEFCPRGAAAACATFRYRLPFPVAAVFPRLNAAGTLGTVQVDGVGDNDAPVRVFAFDLARGARVGDRAAEAITPLDHGFLVDDTLYSPAFHELGALATTEQAWAPLGGTDRVVVRDRRAGQLVVQDTTTARVVARISLGGATPGEAYALVGAADGATLYAVGQGEALAEVLVIDLAAQKVIARVTPEGCSH